jgi:hypothetical protein
MLFLRDPHTKKWIGCEERSDLRKLDFKIKKWKIFDVIRYLNDET